MNEHEERIACVRKILQERALGAAIVYACAGDDGIFRWLIGTFSIEADYLIITENKLFLVCPEYLVENIRERIRHKGLNYLPGPGPGDLGPLLQQTLVGIAKAGFAGSVPYRDVLHLQAELSDLSAEIDLKRSIKSSSEILLLAKACALCEGILESADVREGVSEKDLARQIMVRCIQTGCEIAFLPSIVSGPRLKNTTDGTPTARKLQGSDVVCIDIGIRYENYVADIARCVAIGGTPASSALTLLREVQDAAIANITTKMDSHDLLGLYQSLCCERGLEFNPEDLGHGIGCSLHEMPSIGEDAITLQDGMVFTLEPEIITSNGRLRIEDMVVMQNGAARRLCELQKP